MKWIKASERLPEVLLGTSEMFFCRNIKDGSKKVLWYGLGKMSLLLSKPFEYEWLDESADQETSALRAENERLRGLLKMANHLVGNPGTNISSSTDLACDNWQKEYSKLNSVNSLEVETSALRAENERLRGLIKSAFFKAHLVGGDNYYLEEDWNKFESENNLQYGLPT